MYLKPKNPLLPSIRSDFRTTAKSAISTFLTFVLSIVFLVQTPNLVGATVTDPCDGTYASNSITVSPSHGKVFYIDSGQGQAVDAAYAGYVVSASAAKTNLWVRVDTFSGGVVSLANPTDHDYRVGDIASGSSKTSFFLLKANSSTVRAQSHIVRVYNESPDLAGAQEIYSCIFSFSQVKETIKANPNKVTAVSTTPTSTSNMALGSSFSITVLGDTGQIGAGSNPDLDMMWMSPAAKSNWPTNALRLESTVVKFADVASKVSACTATTGASKCLFRDQLLIKNLKTVATGIKASAKSLAYEAVYTFRVIGKASVAAPVFPISQISSGTQIKHTPIPTTALSTVAADTVTVSATATKTTNSTSTIVGPDTQFTYKIVVNNTSASTGVSIDSITDSPDAALSYVPGTASVSYYSTSSGGSPTSTVTPTAPATLAGSTDQMFAGPFPVVAQGRMELTYKMSAPTCSVSSTYNYSNGATAKIGELVIGTTASTYSEVSASGNCGDTNVTNTSTPTTLAPEVTTTSATEIATTTATLNGLVDANGQSGQLITFEYGTNPTLDGATSVTVGNTTTSTIALAQSASLTGLATGTLYYFRIKTGNYAGEILSFSTLEPVGTPAISTDPATGVSTSGVTFNGTLDPNQNTLYAGFTFGTSPSLSGGTSIVLLDDPTAAAGPNNPYSVFSGSFPANFSLELTAAQLGVAAGTVVFYRADYYTSANGSIVGSGVIRSFTLTTYTNQTLTFASVADKAITLETTNPPVTTTAPGLTPVLTSSTPNICTVSDSPTANTVTLLALGECTLIANQDGGQSGAYYYLPADPVVQTFQVIRGSRALTIDSSSYAASYSAWDVDSPILTSTATFEDNVGTKTYSLDPTSTGCQVDEVTGHVAFTGAGTCKVIAHITQGTLYNAATSAVVSFNIGKKAQVLDFPDQSGSTITGSLELSATTNATTNNSDLATTTYVIDPSQTSTAGCSITGSSLNFTQGGTCYVLASNGGGSNWTAATRVSTVTVSSKAPRSLVIKSKAEVPASYDPEGYSDWDQGGPALAAVPDHSDSGDTLTYALAEGSTGCLVDESTGVVTFTGAGTCKIRSSISESQNYTSANSSTISFVVGKKQQQITNFADVTKEVPDSSETFAASSNATSNNTGIGNVTYEIVTDGSAPVSSAGCSIVGSEVHFTTAGSCYVRATRYGNSHWTDASSIVTVSVNRASRSIQIKDSSFATTYESWSDAAPALESLASFDDGDAKSYSLADGSTGCTVSDDGQVAFTGAGTCRVKVHVFDGARYSAADSPTISIEVGKRNQSITNFTDESISYVNAAHGFAANTDATTNADDLGAVTYEIDAEPGAEESTSGCAIANGALEFTQAGTCYVRASRGGNSHWNSVTQVRRIDIIRAARTISLNSNSYSLSYSDWSVNGPQLASTASADDDDAKVYELDGLSDACEITSAGKLNFVGTGSCRVKVSVEQGSRYNRAVSDVITINVGKRPQEITNFSNRSVTYTDGSQTFAAGSDAVTNTSGLPSVRYEIVTNSDAPESTSGCSITGETLAFTRAGTCYVRATRGGNTHWLAGSAISTVSVGHSDRTISIKTVHEAAGSFDPDGYADWSVSAPTLVSLASHDNGDNKVYETAEGSEACTVNASSGEVEFTGAGTCKVKVTIQEGARYKNAVSSIETFVIGKRQQELDFPDQSGSVVDGSVSLDASTNATSRNAGLGNNVYEIDPDSSSSPSCAVSGNALTFTEPGECFVRVTRSGNTNWTDARKVAKFTIGAKPSRTIRLLPKSLANPHSYDPLGYVSWGETAPTLLSEASDDDSDSKTYELASGSSGCTVTASGQVTFEGAGNCRVRVTIHEGTRFNQASSQVVEFPIGKRNQSITGISDRSVGYVDGAQPLSANSDVTVNTDGLPDVAFEIAPTTGQTTSTANCAVENGALHFEKAGDCFVQVTRGGNAHWNPAAAIVKYVIAHSPRTIAISNDSFNSRYSSWAPTVDAPALVAVSNLDDGDPVTYSLANNSQGCEVDSTNGAVTFTGAGVCRIRVEIAQGNRYLDATSEEITFEIGKREQMLSMEDAEVPLASESLDLSSTTNATVNNSDLAETTYEILTGDPDQVSTEGCAITDNVLTFTQEGSCYVVALNSGSTQWTSATKVARYIVSATLKAPRTLTIFSRTRVDEINVSTDIQLEYSLEHGSDTVTWTAGPDEVCEINSSGLLLAKSEGECTVSASVTETESYLSATANSLNFLVKKAAQEITLRVPDTTLKPGDSTEMSVSGQQGTGAISYQIVSGSDFCSLRGRVLTAEADGSCRVRASITEDARFLSAVSEPVTIEVSSQRTIPEIDMTPSGTPVSTPTPTVTSTPKNALANTSETPTPSVTNQGNASGNQGNSGSELYEGSLLRCTPNAPGTSLMNDTIKADLGTSKSHTCPEAAKLLANGGAVDTAVRSFQDLDGDLLNGFGTPHISIDVMGSKVTGQFIVSPGSISDPYAVAAALEESSQRNSTEFASIDSAQIGKQPILDQVLAKSATQAMKDIFEISGLGKPQTVGEIKTDSATRWLSVSGEVRGYKPNSVVYLAVTSEPLVFAYAEVNSEGYAQIIGDLPLDVLPSGGHNIRIVGTREFSGVSLDKENHLVMTRSVLENIQQFDQGTNAIVRITGITDERTRNVSIRIVPIAIERPWWTVWFAAGVAVVLGTAKRRRRMETRTRKTIWSLIGLASAAPAVILGWYSLAYDVMGIGVLISLLGAIGVQVIQAKRADRRAHASQTPEELAEISD